MKINKYLKRLTIVLTFICSMSVLLTSHASFFLQGSKSISVFLGSGSAFNDNYTIVGVGAGYHVLDGLEIGLDAQTWLGGEPSINKISPRMQYVFTQSQKLKPYIGLFYQRTFTDGFEDSNSMGGRLGLYFTNPRGHYFGVGVVQENYLDCDESVFVSCSNTYPEITFSIAL